MANLPFGFGLTSDQPAEQPTRGGSTKQLMRQINYGMQNAPMGRGGMGAVMGFMGLPFMSRGNGAGQNSLGPWTRFDPRRLPFNPGGNGGPNTGGEDPPLDPNDPPIDDGNGGTSAEMNRRLLELLFPPPIGTGAQWRNTMKYGA